MSKSKYLTIGDDTINTEGIDYMNKKTGQKQQKKEGSDEVETQEVYLINIVYQSGVQVAIPFEKQEARDRVHQILLNNLGSNKILF